MSPIRRIDSHPRSPVALQVLQRGYDRPAHALLPSEGRFRTVFISDLHLGWRHCRAEELLGFLRDLSTEKLYLVGDVVDEWKLRDDDQVQGIPSSHLDVLSLLASMAHQGTEVIYVPGNHDDGLRRPGLPAIEPLTIRQDDVHETADGRRLLVVHGDDHDGLADESARLVRFGVGAYELALTLNTLFNRLTRRLGLPYRSISLPLKQGVKRAMEFVGRYQGALLDEARRRGLDGVVCGHVHHAALREVDGLLYANDGDWVESCTALVEHHDGRLELMQWRDGRLVPLAAGSYAAPPPARWEEVLPAAARGSVSEY
ncbi:MAG: UDP-2,3-diacylglucosamine diphosphatase [Acidobacteriota bacterium]